MKALPSRRFLSYKLLLMKYMDWMIEQHGDDFVHTEMWSPPNRFTADEWEELKKLSQIIDRAYENIPKIPVETKGLEDE